MKVHLDLLAFYFGYAVFTIDLASDYSSNHIKSLNCSFILNVYFCFMLNKLIILNTPRFSDHILLTEYDEHSRSFYKCPNFRLIAMVLHF